MTKDEFDFTFKETLDAILVAMAENSEIEHNKFYSMACVLENLSFFSPVIYGAMKKKEE